VYGYRLDGLRDARHQDASQHLEASYRHSWRKIDLPEEAVRLAKSIRIEARRISIVNASLSLAINNFLENVSEFEAPFGRR